MISQNVILYGHILTSNADRTLSIHENHYLVCENGKCAGIFPTIPTAYSAFPVRNHENQLIIPGFSDLHVHAPQYGYRGLGMDLELLDWLETYTFPEEAKYDDVAYAELGYGYFTADLRKGGTTRAACFATASTNGTLTLMRQLEQTGLRTYVGRVNMDRNCTNDDLREASAEQSLADTKDWIAQSAQFERTQPIITPRFTPSCTDELMQGLGELAKDLPVQSHLNENLGEISWVGELCPTAKHYTDTYDRVGLLGNRTIMAHCVYMPQEERDLLKETGAFVAHCPASNTNIASGISPVRHMMDQGINIGLGTDVAGGHSLSIFRAMADAIQMSKMYWRLLDQTSAPLTVADAFYLATRGGGAYFGKVGAFEEGYDFDALVLDDSAYPSPLVLSPLARLERVIYLGEDRTVQHKYVAGCKLF